MALLLCSACSEPVSGTLEVRNASGDAFRFTPEECFDGGEHGYWGVQFRDEDGRVVDVFKRGEVPHAIVYSPGRVAFEVELSACEVFEGRLERRAVNGSGTMKGDLTLDCSDGEGRQLAGDLVFKDCGAYDDDDNDNDDFGAVSDDD